MSMEEIIANFEGMRTSVYNDTRGIKTIGVGFNLEQSDGRQIFEEILPEVSFDDVFYGKTDLSEDQALKLFRTTLAQKVETTKSLFPDYDDYPEDVQTALVNGVFRGEHKASHKTVKLINNGRWSEVADEYLDRKDYRNSKPGKDFGIRKRMDYNANIFRIYADSLKNN